MLPMRDVRLALGELLAADADTLAPASDPNMIMLIGADFTKTENRVIGDLTEVVFTGYAAKAGAAGAQQAGLDPATGQQVVTVLQPAGGYRFECSAAPDEPVPVFGYALVNNDKSVLLALEKFDSVIYITNEGDFIDIGTVTMKLSSSPLS